VKKKKWLIIIIGGFFVLGAFFLKGGRKQQYVFSSSTCPLPQGGGKIVSIPANTDWVSAISGLKPGDVAQLEAGTYYPTGKKITVSGTANEPITICGSGYLETTINGNKGSAALRIDKSNYVVLQNVQVTNPSPIGNPLDPDDPAHTYSNTARHKLPPTDPGYSPLAEGIVIQGGSSYITIKDSYFHDVATRGIIISSSYSHDVLIEHNMFLHVGDDTASADISVGGEATEVTLRENLLGGNVDGAIIDGVGTGHLVDRNLIVSHNWEDGIDIKGHRPISLYSIPSSYPP